MELGPTAQVHEPAKGGRVSKTAKEKLAAPVKSTEDMVADAVELPFGVTVAVAVHSIPAESSLDSIVVTTLVFQLEEGGDLLRQSFGIDPDLAALLSEALTNPITLTEEGNNQ